MLLYSAKIQSVFSRLNRVKLFPFTFTFQTKTLNYSNILFNILTSGKNCKRRVVNYNTVILSFLKRERDFSDVSDRLSCTVWTFLTIQRHNRSPFLTVPDRSWRFHERFWPFCDVLLRIWTFFYRLKLLLPLESVLPTS